MKYGTRLIAGGAFEDCSKLKTVILGKKVKSIGFHAFYDCAIKTVTISKNVKKLVPKRLDTIIMIKLKNIQK